MKMTLTEFRRKLPEARAAADRGKIVTVKSRRTAYLFLRVDEKPKRPFADLEPLFGSVHLKRRIGRTSEKIRRRLKAPRGRRYH
jgi:hypothetical protein